MESVIADNSIETERLLQSVADGDQQSWGTLLIRHEERLRRMVAYRMDQRLQGRIDPQDVIQDAYLEASEHRAEAGSTNSSRPLRSSSVPMLA
jgi:RNA polymerase sigma-70 factor, ECF subfamily